MAVIFATNSARDLQGNSVVYTGAAEARDTAYADEEVAVEVGGALVGDMAIPSWVFEQADYEELWLHFRMKTNSTISNGGSDGIFLSVTGGIFANSLLLDIDNGDIRAEGTGAPNGAYWSPAGSTLYDIDLHMKCSPTTGVFLRLYVDGVLVSEATSASNRDYITSITFTMTDIGQTGVAENIYFSEIIIDDAESTIGCRLHKAEPSTAGTYSEMTGAVSDIQDIDDGNVLIADANGERFSWNPPAYTGDVSSGTNVRAVIVQSNTKMAVDTLGPDKLSHFLRIGSTDYYSSQQTPGGGNPSVNYTYFATDPSDGLDWDINDMGTFEVGIRAET